MCKARPWSRFLVVAVLVLAGCNDENDENDGIGGTGGAVRADAGADQEAAEGTMVTLEGIGDGSTFSWTQLSGPTVTLNGADQATTSFETPWIVEESAAIELELTVSDGAQSATDTVLVTITNTHFVLFLADKDEAGRVELYRAPLGGESNPIKLSRPPMPGGNVVGPSGPGANVVDFFASPDGRYVAYVGNIEQNDAVELFVVASTGGDSIKLNGALVSGGNVRDSSFPSSPAWSPDSSRIAYEADQDTDEVFELYTTAPDGSGNVKLNGTLAPGAPGARFQFWSPDSSRIAYRAVQDTDENFEVYSSRPDGSGNVKLSAPLGRGAGQARVSPDGNHIFYIGGGELYSSAPDGSGHVKLNLVMGRIVLNALWSPDSSRVAYEGCPEDDPSEGCELYSNATDGSDNVKHNGTLVLFGEVFTFRWSPDSSRIAYEATQDTVQAREVYSSPADGSSNVQVSGTLVLGGQASSARWSPDSSRIAYNADQDTDEGRELYTSAPDGSGNVKISGTPVMHGDVLSAATWSPDSSRIAYAADQGTDGVVELYAGAPDGSGNVKLNGTLVTGGNVVNEFSRPFLWSPDSSRIVYLADQDTDEVFELYSTAPDGNVNVLLSGALAPGGGVQKFTVE